jgi:hypothetical protein
VALATRAIAAVSARALASSANKPAAHARCSSSAIANPCLPTSSRRTSAVRRKSASLPPHPSAAASLAARKYRAPVVKSFAPSHTVFWYAARELVLRLRHHVPPSPADCHGRFIAIALCNED